VTPLYPQKLALTSPTGGGRSVGIVRSRTKATEFVSKSSKSSWEVSRAKDSQRFGNCHTFHLQGFTTTGYSFRKVGNSSIFRLLGVREHFPVQTVDVITSECQYPVN